MSPQSATAMQTVKVQTTPVKQNGPMSIIDHMQEIHDAIARRAFELFETNGRWSGRELDDWVRAESEFIQPMHLELTESDSYFNVRAEVPGFNAKELEIDLEPLRLTVTGKHETKDETKKGKTTASN